MNDFLTEYKHLEKLCNEIYDCQHGISQYITDMEQTSPSVSRGIAGWESDLKTLKKLRHIRNAIVHDMSDYDADYGLEDLSFLKDFHGRIMQQEDPLAVRRGRGGSDRSVKQRMVVKTDKDTKPIKAADTGNATGKRNYGVVVLVAVVVVLVIVTLLKCNTFLGRYT